MTSQKVRDAVLLSAERLETEQIDLMQFHWWNYEHPHYLEAMEGLQKLKQERLILNLGLTNFDTDHFHLLLQEGIQIISNQVVVSLFDRRALGDMSRLCLQHGIKLLAYYLLMKRGELFQIDQAIKLSFLARELLLQINKYILNLWQ